MVAFATQPQAPPVANRQPSPYIDRYQPRVQAQSPPPINVYDSPGSSDCVNEESAQEHDLERILSGGSCVKSYEGTSQYARQGISTCGLASFNAARHVLGLEKSGFKGKDLLQSMMDRNAVEQIVKICSSWTSSAHLEVEEIHEMPMFRRALQVVGQDYSQAKGEQFMELLRRLRELVKPATGSAVAIITKPPEIITVFCIATGNIYRPVVYVVFDSHSRPDTHPLGAAFTFFGAITEAGRYLSRLLSVDPGLFRGADMQWQAQLLSQFSAHYIIAEDQPPDTSDDTLLFETNLSILEAKSATAALKTRMDEMGAENTELKKANISFGQQIKDLHRERTLLSEQLRSTKEAMSDQLRRVKEELTDTQMELRRAESRMQREAKNKEREDFFDQGADGYADYTNYPPLPRPPTVWNDFRLDPEFPQRMGRAGPSRVSFGSDRMHNYQQAAQQSTIRFPFAPQNTFTPQDWRRQQTQPRPPPQPRPRQAFEDDHAMALRLQRELEEQDRMDAATAAAIQRDLDEEERRIRNEHEELLNLTFSCSLCMEDHLDKEFVVEIEPCGHTSCRECLRGYLSSSIEQGKFPIGCPDCSTDKGRKDVSFISRAVAEMLGLTEEESQKWWNFEMFGVSVSVDCRKCNQTNRVDKADFDGMNIIPCPTRGCANRWCKKCSQEVTGDGSTHTCDGTNELDGLMREQGWKRCPGCQTPTEKTAGCNRMTCQVPGCNTHFCYIDGALIVKSANPEEVRVAVAAYYGGNCPGGPH